MNVAEHSFSLIIPTLNEATHIGSCIAAVRAIAPTVEIIIADGGSTDATTRIATEAGVRVCHAPRGRGPQCNAGAAMASGEVLVFLHADTRLPANAFDLLQILFQHEQAQIGKFRLSFDTEHWLLDFAARCMWFDSILTSYGDQCIAIRRSFFTALGGFPDWPLFEDVRLFELARQHTRVYVLPAEVVTSARRFIDNGIFTQLLRDLWYMFQYLLGVPPETIAARYERRGAQLRQAEQFATG